MICKGKERYFSFLSETPFLTFRKMCHIGTFTVVLSIINDSLFDNLMLEYIQYPWQRDIEGRICNLFNIDYVSSDEEEEQEEDGE